MSKQKQRRPRPARLRVRSLAVECQDCGATQPDADGSFVWLSDEFTRERRRRRGRSRCVACGRPFSLDGVVFDVLVEPTEPTTPTTGTPT